MFTLIPLYSNCFSGKIFRGSSPLQTEAGKIGGGGERPQPPRPPMHDRRHARTYVG